MNNNFKTLATKLSEKMWCRVKAIADKKGLKVYELMQAALFLYLRMEDVPEGLSETEEAARLEFEESLATRFPTANLNKPIKIIEGIYFLQTKKGTCGVAVGNPFSATSKATFSYNVKHIVEHVFCLLLPVKYRALRIVGNEIGSNSILETLNRLIIFYEEATGEKDFIKTLFSENDFSDYGKSQREMKKYKGHYNKEIERL